MGFDQLVNRQNAVFSGGVWRPGSGAERLDVVDPSTNTVFATIGTASAEDVVDAACAADRAYLPWRNRLSAERAEFLKMFASGLAARRDDLVRLQMTNNGKPRVEAEIDVGDAIATFEYYAGLAEALDERQFTPVEHGGGMHRGLTRFEPVGPVGMIVPWNFPMVTSAWKIAPALAAGCTVVMKTSEMTPLIELVYADIAEEAGLPTGVLNIVTGAAEAGIALTGDARFRKISFTGSNMIGARVMAAVADRCLPIALELGGKSPIVVFDDADLDTAVDCIIGGIFFNCGQMCSATSRLIVDEKTADPLMELLVARTRSLKVGTPFEQDTSMGPLSNAAQFEKVISVFEQARGDGLSCAAGGNAVGNGDGFFVEPTIYMDVPTDNPVWREEIFGPVLAVRTFRKDEEAFALADDSDYGLVASIVSGNLDRAQAAAARIDGGQIWINTPQVVYPDSAWGGFKASGIGRELGPWGLSAYLGVKHLTLPA